MDTKDMTTRDAEFHTELFGENTYIFSPEDDPGQVAQTLVVAVICNTSMAINITLIDRV